MPSLLESPLEGDGASKRQPGSRRVLQPTEGIHLGKGAPCGFGRTYVSDEFTTLIRGKDLRGVLRDCLMLHLSNTTRLGQAHGHRKLAPSAGGGGFSEIRYHA